MERRRGIGASHRVLRSLIDAFNRDRAGLSWHTDVEYVTQPEAFREVADRHRGTITEIEFTFNPANALRGFDRFKAFDKAMKAETNAEQTSYALKSSTGSIDPSGELLDEAVEYAHEGAGQTKIKSGKSVLYNSRSAKTTREVDEALLPREGEIGLISTAANLLHEELRRRHTRQKPQEK